MSENSDVGLHKFHCISQAPDFIWMCLTSGEICQENRKFAT